MKAAAGVAAKLCVGANNIRRCLGMTSTQVATVAVVKLYAVV
jgi:hypothetical protein